MMWLRHRAPAAWRDRGPRPAGRVCLRPV